jgi:thiamine kinase-like enzyme
MIDNSSLYNSARKLKYSYKNIVEFIKFKIFFYNSYLKVLGIKNIKSVVKSGQGFCDTYIIKANKNIVLKINNQTRFEYFRDDFKKVEPIYVFKEYQDRFLHEKEFFERLCQKKVIILNDAIAFPFIDSKPLSVFLYKNEFFTYLKNAIEILRSKNISHGDFHIENILIDTKNNIVLIDFEMIFGDYLSKEEQFYYDIYYFFAKLECNHKEFFKTSFDKLKSFVKENFTTQELEAIIAVSNKTKRYFFSVNGAKIELFR